MPASTAQRADALPEAPRRRSWGWSGSGSSRASASVELPPPSADAVSALPVAHGERPDAGRPDEQAVESVPRHGSAAAGRGRACRCHRTTGASSDSSSSAADRIRFGPMITRAARRHPTPSPSAADAGNDARGRTVAPVASRTSSVGEHAAGEHGSARQEQRPSAPVVASAAGRITRIGDSAPRLGCTHADHRHRHRRSSPQPGRGSHRARAAHQHGRRSADGRRLGRRPQGGAARGAGRMHGDGRGQPAAQEAAGGRQLRDRGERRDGRRASEGIHRHQRRASRRR